MVSSSVGTRTKASFYLKQKFRCHVKNIFHFRSFCNICCFNTSGLMIVRLMPAISYCPRPYAVFAGESHDNHLDSAANVQTKWFCKNKQHAFFCRYMAIVHPLRHRRSKTRTQTVLVLIWLISVFLAMPCILYSNLKTKRYDLNRC